MRRKELVIEVLLQNIDCRYQRLFLSVNIYENYMLALFGNIWASIPAKYYESWFIHCATFCICTQKTCIDVTSHDFNIISVYLLYISQVYSVLVIV